MKVNFVRQFNGNVNGEVRFYPETELDEKVLEQIKQNGFCRHHLIGEYMSVQLKPSVEPNVASSSFSP